MKYLPILSNMLIEDIIKIVKDASKLMKVDFSVEEKGSSSNLVTSSDKNVQEYLHIELRKIVHEAKFFAEENALKETFGKEDKIFIIDPIDGTANFVHKLGLSVISVALMIDNEIKIGVIYNPFTDECFYAEKGKGAYLNDKRIHVSNRELKYSLLATSFSCYEKQYANVCFDVLNNLYPLISDMRRLGSCALELCYIAAGRLDLYYEYYLQIYDFAAGYLILKEAGGYIETIGNLSFTSANQLIAANRLDNFEILKKQVIESNAKYQK